MIRSLWLGLLFMAAALGGCSTALETRRPSADDRDFPPAMTSPTPRPGNVFFPSPGPHYHRSMGP